MFQGLHVYELILMISGGVLFLALVFALIWNVIKNKSIVSLLPFFLLPVVMIGWPTINSVTYDNGKIEIQKTADELISNPADTVAQKKLELSIASFDTSRAKSDPVALNNISHAYYALGKYDSAGIFNTRALKIKPDFQEAINFKATIQKQAAVKSNFKASIQQLDSSLNTVGAGKTKASPAATKKLINILKTTEQPVYTDEKSNLLIAKGLATVNKNEKSLEIVNKVLQANPKSQEALQLKKDIEARKYNTLGIDSEQTKSLDTKKFNAVIKYRPVKQ